MGILLIFALMCLSSVFRALHNTLIHHFSTSIFKGKNDQWWDPNISWLNKYKNNDVKQGFKKWFGNINYPVQITDGWHFFNTLEIITNWLTVVAVLVMGLSITDWFTGIVFIILSFVCYNLTFSIFYDYVYLKNKTLKDYLK